ncbi:2568_t:CDS:1, partial [Scutellospora calospora]
LVKELKSLLKLKNIKKIKEIIINLIELNKNELSKNIETEEESYNNSDNLE